MIGRGAYGKPWLINQIMHYLKHQELLADPSLEEQRRIIIAHYKDMLEHYGEDVGLRNLIYVDSAGVKKDYDKQSKDVIKFRPGDVISVYVETQGGVSWKDAINLVKIEIE